MGMEMKAKMDNSLINYRKFGSHTLIKMSQADVKEECVFRCPCATVRVNKANLRSQ